MKTSDYWKECISIGADDCGLVLTPEQLESLANAAESGHESYGMSFYSPPAGEHERMESDRLRVELSAERNKVGCKDCSGTGRLSYAAGPWAVNSHCDRCNGNGKHAP